MSRSTIVRGAAVVVICAILAGGFYAYNRKESGASVQTTDDAYVQADLTVISPQVSGRIETVAVRDNQLVRTGDLLVQIDDRDLRVALEGAIALVARAQAMVTVLEAQIEQQASEISQAKAAVDADEATLTLAIADQVRFRNLAKDGSGSVQAMQKAEAERRVKEASRRRDQAALASAQQQTDVLRADLEKAKAELAQAQAAQAAAKLNLSYTHIVAPVAGVVAQRSARVGAYVTTGRPLLTLVPLDTMYVEANFRETQIARMRPGQPVQIEVDALPGLKFTGRIDSLGPASEVSFSPLPPHNATGNFTKIVQRLPVKIAIDSDQPHVGELRVGMSVLPQIKIE